MVALLLGSVALVFWYEAIDPESGADLRRTLEWIDLGLVLFFVAEWLWRVKRSAPDSRRYALRYSWELLGMIPIILPLPTFLRALRLLRVVRILRVFGKVGAALGTWERIAKQGSIHKIALAAGTVTFAGAILVWALEREKNPEFTYFRDALWWAIVTVATVGYGDIVPRSNEGRFVASLLMVAGIGTIGLLASSLASVLVVREQKDAQDAAQVTGPLPAAAGALAQQLQALADLHAQGKLTDDEFARAKAKLLG